MCIKTPREVDDLTVLQVIMSMQVSHMTNVCHESVFKLSPNNITVCGAVVVGRADLLQHV